MVEEKVIIESVEEVEIASKQKLWTLNFFLLWQGQLVSTFGSSIYSIILGFWVLKETGSTAVMGGEIAEFIPIGIIISGASTVILAMFIILSFTKKATDLIVV